MTGKRTVPKLSSRLQGYAAEAFPVHRGLLRHRHPPALAGSANTTSGRWESAIIASRHVAHRPEGRSRHVDPPSMPAPQYQLFAIGKDAPPGALTLTRTPQRTFKGRRGAGEGLASRTRKAPLGGGAFGPARRGRAPYIIPSIPPMPPPGGIAGPSSFFGFSATVASGGDQQPRNRRGILQRRSHHLRRSRIPSSPGHRTPRSAR